MSMLSFVAEGGAVQLADMATSMHTGGHRAQQQQQQRHLYLPSRLQRGFEAWTA